MTELREMRTEGGRTPIGAKPPTWMEDAWCAPEWPHPDGRLHASPWDQDKTSDEKAAELCAGCPVIAECLSSAMAEEGTLTARNRYGVRGGLGPEGRARLAVEDRECVHGHKGQMVPDRSKSGGDKWRCLECDREKARQKWANATPEQKERKNARRKTFKTECPQCGQVMLRQSLPKHIERMHTEAGQMRSNQRAGRAA